MLLFFFSFGTFDQILFKRLNVIDESGCEKSNFFVGLKRLAAGNLSAATKFVWLFRDSPADESEDRSESNPRILFQNIKCVRQGKTI